MTFVNCCKIGRAFLNRGFCCGYCMRFIFGSRCRLYLISFTCTDYCRDILKFCSCCVCVSAFSMILIPQINQSWISWTMRLSMNWPQSTDVPERKLSLLRSWDHFKTGMIWYVCFLVGLWYPNFAVIIQNCLVYDWVSTVFLEFWSALRISELNSLWLIRFLNWKETAKPCHSTLSQNVRKSYGWGTMFVLLWKNVREFLWNWRTLLLIFLVKPAWTKEMMIVDTL